MMTTAAARQLPEYTAGRARRALAGLLGLLCLASPASAAPSAAESLLSAMFKAQNSVSFSAVEQVSRPGAPTIIMRLWRQGDRRRTEFLQPPVQHGDLLVDDGVNVWLYHRSDNSAVETRHAVHRRGGAMLHAKVSRAFEARLVGQARVSGRQATIIQVDRRDQPGRRRKLWIDNATHIRLRAETYASDGRRVEVRSLQNVRFAAVPASTFHWVPSPGVKVTHSGMLYTDLHRAQKATPWLRYPRRLPRGYVFESAVADPARQDAWLRYTNGISRFSVFEQRAGVTGDAAPRSAAGGSRYWQSKGVRYLMVGVAPADVSRVENSF